MTHSRKLNYFFTIWTISRLVCTERGPERRDDTATREVREVFRLMAALLHLKTGTRWKAAEV